MSDECNCGTVVPCFHAELSALRASTEALYNRVNRACSECGKPTVLGREDKPSGVQCYYCLKVFCAGCAPKHFGTGESIARAVAELKAKDREAELSTLRDRLAAAETKTYDMEHAFDLAKERADTAEAERDRLKTEAARVHSVRYEGKLGQMRTLWLDAQNDLAAERAAHEEARRKLAEVESARGSAVAAGLEYVTERRLAMESRDRERAARVQAEAALSRAKELLDRWMQFGRERWHDHATTKLVQDTLAFADPANTPKEPTP